MDPLSDVLSLLKPENTLSAGFEAGGDWAIQFPDQGKSIKCGAVVSGWCWLAVEGVAEPVRLDAGDCFLLPSGRPFRMASDLRMTPLDAATIFRPVRTGGIVSLDGGRRFSLVSSRFALAGDHADLLLGVLPPIVLIRSRDEQEALRWSVERMMQELRLARPGGFLVTRHLAHMILVQALRLHLAESPGGVGWLFALADRQIGAAIAAMHAEPARRWTLAMLADAAAMSRSAFAARFKATVGASPLDYLTRWRMLLAADRLAAGREPIAAIALAVGYQSESAFGAAFRRVMAASPRHYGRAAPSTGPAETAGALDADPIAA